MYTFKIVTNKILEIIFNLFFRYFTSWMLLFHFIYHLGINNFQYSLLLLSIFVSIFGFVISYVYPKFINVPYLNISIKGYYLKLFDLVFHQIPLILLLYVYNKKIKNDNLILALVLLILYLVFNNPIKVYNL